MTSLTKLLTQDLFGYKFRVSNSVSDVTICIQYAVAMFKVTLIIIIIIIIVFQAFPYFTMAIHPINNIINQNKYIII